LPLCRRRLETRFSRRVAALAKLAEHLQYVKQLYEKEILALANSMIGETGLSEEFASIIAIEVDDGFALQFKFKDK